MTQEQYDETAAKYGKDFASHAASVLAPDSYEEIDFCICDTCGQPFPEGKGIESEQSEYCSRKCEYKFCGYKF